MFFVTLLLSGCNRARQEQGQEDDDVTMDLPQLKAQGEITAVTLYSSTSYFQYKMQPMGYEYELIKDFARSEGLKLNIKAAESPTKLIEMLEAGEADVVAYPIQISNRMKEKLIYCGREEQDCQVLIQQANKGDKVITAGGIYGTVKEIKETTLLIEVDGNVTLRIDKNMVVADNSDLQRQ